MTNNTKICTCSVCKTSDWLYDEFKSKRIVEHWLNVGFEKEGNIRVDKPKKIDQIIYELHYFKPYIFLVYGLKELLNDR